MRQYDSNGAAVTALSLVTAYGLLQPTRLSRPTVNATEAGRGRGGRVAYSISKRGMAMTLLVFESLDAFCFSLTSAALASFASRGLA